MGLSLPCPAQYLTLRATIAGEDIRRSYSICSGLDDGDLRIVVKRVAGGAFSNFVHDGLKPGSEIDVMTPAGQFTIPSIPRRRGRWSRSPAARASPRSCR